MTIKVKDIYSSSKAKEIVLTGHTAPILSVSLDPKSEFLVSLHLKIPHYLAQTVFVCFAGFE
jgi:WD40 repeat protein